MLSSDGLRLLLLQGDAQCSCLEKPRVRGAWWASVYGVTRSRTRLKRLSSSSSRSCQSPTPSRAKKLSVSVSGKGLDLSLHTLCAPCLGDDGSLECSSLPPRAKTREPSHDSNGAPTLVQKWELELFTHSPCPFSLYIHLHISS